MSKRNIKTWVEAEVHPSAYDLAEVFWEMDAEEQAGFFHRLAEVSGDRLVFQLQNVIESPYLTKEARAAMVSIGDYGSQQ